MSDFIGSFASFKFSFHHNFIIFVMRENQELGACQYSTKRFQEVFDMQRWQLYIESPNPPIYK